MVPFFPTETTLSLTKIAQQIGDYWREKSTFKQSLEASSSYPPLCFYEGPPGANGKPGIHHVFARTLKDLYCRYKTMCGFHIMRKSGWDTHGLPVELMVEKELGITKEDIGKKISIEVYNKACQEAVMRYQASWEEMTDMLGYWIDLEHPYLTYHPHFISTLWGLLKKLYDKGLLYKGYTIQPYSPAAGTGLSSHEINQPGCYKEVKDTSIVVQCQVKGEHHLYLLAWTTTPWTLPANSALAVDCNLRYVRIATFNRYTQKAIEVILAEEVVPRYFDAKQENAPMDPPKTPQDALPWRVLRTYSGEALLGWEYHPLFTYITPEKSAFRIIAGDFIHTDEGTGVVHIAPTFGADDARVAKQEDIPPIMVKGKDGTPVPIVDKQGRFVAEITDFAGAYVKEAYALSSHPDELPVDVRIAIKLKQENKAFLVESYTHTYPHCWRTNKPILYYPLDAWFIKTTACKERLIELNKQIKWQPPSTGEGRFGDWLSNLQDWNLSRSRFWGTPLPIWRSKDGKEEICIGGIQHLREEVDKAIKAGVMSKPLPETPDLHRPYVDEIILVSPQGTPLYRETDVIDVWFDSGGMPYAQAHDPDYDPNTLPKAFPADFIIEGVDQTRGWFFTLHALSVLLHDQVAFKQVLSFGLVLDKEGNKMSKSLKNTIDPFKLLSTYGADVIRWYMVSNGTPWENMKFDVEALPQITRKYFATLHNTYAFFALYANLDGFIEQHSKPSLEHATQSDRWILAKLQHVIASTREHLDAFFPTQAARLLQSFMVDHLSNWYVRLNRKRFWQGGMSEDKRTAYQILHYCLRTLAQLAAPIAPFYMDHLYAQLCGREVVSSVHLTVFPQVQEEYLNPSLEEAMDLAQRITSLVHRLRKQEKIKVRQPLAQLLIPVVHSKQKEQIEQIQDLICHEVNVKKLILVEQDHQMVTYKVRPDFPTLGKRYGAQMKAIASLLAQLSQEEIRAFQEKGSYSLSLNPPIELNMEDVHMVPQSMPGWATAHEQGMTIALDLQLTEELQQEGIARELVNRIQNFRKEEGLAVEDKIKLYLKTNSTLLQEAIRRFEGYIAQEVQAVEVHYDIEQPKTLSLALNEGTLEVALEVSSS